MRSSFLPETDERLTMKYLIPALKSIPAVLMLWLLWHLAFHYTPAEPGYSPPMLIWLGDTMNLIVHEAGHFFFSLLGRTLYLMGGSIFQVLFPAALTFWIWRKWQEPMSYMLFITGWNLCSVAVYMADAPHRRLRLIKAGLTHDWHAIMNRLGMMESAETLAAIVHWLGVAVCVFAIGYAVRRIVDNVRTASDELPALRE